MAGVLVDAGLLDPRPDDLILGEVEQLHLQPQSVVLFCKAKGLVDDAMIEELRLMHSGFLNAETEDLAEAQLSDDQDEVGLCDRALGVVMDEVMHGDNAVRLVLGDATEIQHRRRGQLRRKDLQCAHNLVLLERIDRLRLVVDRRDEVVAVRLGWLLRRDPLVEEFEAGDLVVVGHLHIEQALYLATAGLVLDHVGL